MKIDENTMLLKMKELAAVAENKTELTATPLNQNTQNFQNVLNNALSSVNDLQHSSKTIAEKYAMGDPHINYVDVIMAGQKSSLAFSALTEVTHRLLSVYDEIKNMPIS